MNGETFRSRLIKLLQRSRQAHRLYLSMEKMQRGEAAEFTEMQAASWRSVNAELIRELTVLLDAPHSRHIANQVVVLRDRFLAQYRDSETALNRRHREVINAAERGDFIRTAVVSRALVGLKASSQAAFAAFSELDEVVGGLGGTGAGSETRDSISNGSDARNAPGIEALSSLQQHDTDVASLGYPRASAAQEVTGADLVRRAAMAAGSMGSGSELGLGNELAAVNQRHGSGFPLAKVIPLRKRL
jgi:hypothetical protein